MTSSATEPLPFRAEVRLPWNMWSMSSPAPVRSGHAPDSPMTRDTSESSSTDDEEAPKKQDTKNRAPRKLDLSNLYQSLSASEYFSRSSSSSHSSSSSTIGDEAENTQKCQLTPGGPSHVVRLRKKSKNRHRRMKMSTSLMYFHECSRSDLLDLEDEEISYRAGARPISLCLDTTANSIFATPVASPPLLDDDHLLN
ncbi:hypothetical protein Ciccas_009188 [Cichlidogyrus casuarinus]|uniref:Uncharacterized protein n=1 Tax=Cichlidogyrus casuarinus TaxID=1844966 RepID=A0ABD2PXT2_9PLAT